MPLRIHRDQPVIRICGCLLGIGFVLLGAFSILGAGLGEFGAARISAEGPVAHLDRVDDFEGSYLAVEAGATAGAGASMLTMRNQHGVVIHVRAESAGLRVALATEWFRIDLE